MLKEICLSLLLSCESIDRRLGLQWPILQTLQTSTIMSEIVYSQAAPMLVQLNPIQYNCLGYRSQQS